MTNSFTLTKRFNRTMKKTAEIHFLNSDGSPVEAARVEQERENYYSDLRRKIIPKHLTFGKYVARYCAWKPLPENTTDLTMKQTI